MSDRVFLIFGTSCVGKSTLLESLAKNLTEWFICESDEIKEVWEHLQGKKVVVFAKRFEQWHPQIKTMTHRKDYKQILNVALQIMQDVDRPVLYFAGDSKVVKGVMERKGSAKAVFLTASEE